MFYTKLGGPPLTPKKSKKKENKSEDTSETQDGESPNTLGEIKEGGDDGVDDTQEDVEGGGGRKTNLLQYTSDK